MSVRVVMVGEHRFRLPFVDVIPFDVDQDEELGASIKEAEEVQVDVVCWKEKATTNEDTVIDGAHRVIWAHKHGLKKVPIKRRSYASEQEAIDACMELNDKRRHSPDDDRKRRKAERVARVAERRAQGESLRAIAEAEGVSKAQVVSDLASGVQGGCTPESEPKDTTPAAEPATVTGRDGKHYPKAPKRKPKPQPKPTVEKDHFGNELPKSCKTAFLDPWIQETYDFLTTTSEKVRLQRIGDGMRKRAKHYPFFNTKDVTDGVAFIVQYLDDLILHFKDNRPAGVCPACSGQGCSKHCRQSGLVPRNVYEQMKRDEK